MSSEMNNHNNTGNGINNRGTAAIPGKDNDRKLFVGGLTWQTTEKELRDHFEKYGGVESVTVKKDKYTGQSRGFAFIVFSDSNSVEKVLFSSHMINGKKVDVRQVTKKPGKIFVGGLIPAITDEDIRNHFSQYGTVVEIQAPFDKAKNQRKGFCFVTFDDKNVVFQALKTPKQCIKGKEVDVKSVKPGPEDVANPAQGMQRPDMQGWGMNPPLLPGPFYGPPASYGLPYGNGYPNLDPNLPFGHKTRGPRQFQRHQPY